MKESSPLKNFQQHLATFQTKVVEFSTFLFPKQKENKTTIHTYKNVHHGSSFKETTRDCLLRLATLTKTIERQDGAHHGRRTFCSPFRQATGINFVLVNTA